ncbi:MAG: aldo/keto reductase [Treponema sp.]|nr:aldo/keto reductase [Treponema sp.]
MRFPSMFGKTDMRKTEEMIVRSIDAGVNYFDTAWIYPGNEEALGSVLHKNNLRYKVNIATKLPLILLKDDFNANDFDRYLNQSLERLKTDYIDYYLLHMITDMDQWNKLKTRGIVNWISQKKSAGIIKHIGFSFHGQAPEFLKIINDYNWELTQIQYNYFDENFQAGVSGLRAAAAKMPVIVMEPLLGGKLATGLPKEAVSIFNNAEAPAGLETDFLNPPVEKKRKKLSPAGWALAWLWNQAEVTSVLSGMSTMEQLDENLMLAESAAADVLNESHMAVYKSVLELLNRSCKVKCTGCNYCMPCPEGVNIPGAFSAYNARYSMGYMEGIKQYATSTGMTQVKSGSPDQCNKCGKCELRCPQKISIINELVIVHKKMEPWFIKLAGTGARAFLGKKRKQKSY